MACPVSCLIQSCARQQLKGFTRFKLRIQFSLFMHPDQAQNTSSGIQGQEATAVAVIYVTAPTYVIYVTASGSTGN